MGWGDSPYGVTGWGDVLSAILDAIATGKTYVTVSIGTGVSVNGFRVSTDTPFIDGVGTISTGTPFIDGVGTI